MNNHRGSPTIPINAFEYCIILERAHDQLNWGADVHDALVAADALCAVRASNVLVKLLRNKAERLIRHRQELASIRCKPPILN
jgi:hypothetical protein